ncbi:MAG: hypothetical protein RIG68_12485 [Imperialibacter sp.]|uniref:hypothetical protein n=1 Tax=Imperialibacter sp. TaxID=2038411 RepID=UPI0032EF5058
MAPLQQVIEKAKNNPKKLFLFDGFGASLSAFLLGVVLVKLQTLFGIPAATLYTLAAFPVIFAVYDYYCYRRVAYQLGPFLKGIALLNLLYCCLSIGLAVYHYGTITNLGWIYLLIEVLIVGLLALIEIKVAKRLQKFDQFGPTR